MNFIKYRKVNYEYSIDYKSLACVKVKNVFSAQQSNLILSQAFSSRDDFDFSALTTVKGTENRWDTPDSPFILDTIDTCR